MDLSCVCVTAHFQSFIVCRLFGACFKMLPIQIRTYMRFLLNSRTDDTLCNSQMILNVQANRQDSGLVYERIDFYGITNLLQ